MQKQTFKLSALAFLVAFTTHNVFAEDATQLNDVYIKGNKKIHRKTTEITGLGKVVKDSQQLDKEMVLNIRDLTRYDPGISVVEQGQGASTGYSIRGVDKNRIGLAVDGVPQIQYYVSQDNSVNSGAINEIEYENIHSIEISKGASSSEFGSGSLGGSVQFRTKEAGDIIKDGKKWGLQTKTAYSSKNKQFTQSFAAAGQSHGAEALVIYTSRDGKETEAHKDADDKQHSIVYAPYIKRDTSNWFTYEQPNGFISAPQHKVQFPSKNLIMRDTDQYVENKETLSAKDYTGPDRLLPNPLDYNSDSLFLKFGYHINPQHFIGTVFEQTTQDYDSRDMTLPAYWSQNDPKYQEMGSKTNNPAKGIYVDNPLNGLAVFDGLLSAPKKDGSDIFKNGQPFSMKDAVANKHVPVGGRGVNYTRTRFYKDHHKKERYGLYYEFKGKTFLDHLRLSWDHQDIKLTHTASEHNCSIYPNVDEKCTASVDLPWSYYKTQTANYQEKHDLFQLHLDKQYSTWNIRHKVTGLLGYDKFSSKITRHDWYAENAIPNVENNGNGNGYEQRPYQYKLVSTDIYRKEYCSYDGWVTAANCLPSEITGHNAFIGLRDNMKINQYISLGLGARYDEHKFDSNDPYVVKGDYKNFSWNVGTIFKPTANIALSYRISSGFRTPSFRELYGERGNGLDENQKDRLYSKRKLDPEKALNQEVSVAFNGDFGYIEASYFKNNYTNLIARALESNGNNAFSFYNIQDINLEGYNILAKFDFNGIYEKLPEGSYMTLAYNKVKPTKVSTKSGYVYVDTPLLDSIQPERYVVGLGYDNPSDKWGTNLTYTYSSAKDASELQGIRNRGKVNITREATKKRTKSWFTFDLSGYYNFNQNMTLRAGIYNLFNHKYIQWEQLRQTAISSPHQQQEGSYRRFAAPGRNYALSFEMKF